MQFSQENIKMQISQENINILESAKNWRETREKGVKVEHIVKQTSTPITTSPHSTNASVENTNKEFNNSTQKKRNEALLLLGNKRTPIFGKTQVTKSLENKKKNKIEGCITKYTRKYSPKNRNISD